MIYEIVLSRQADSDLRGIYEYIAFELLAPENAEGQLGVRDTALNSYLTGKEETRIYEK